MYKLVLSNTHSNETAIMPITDTAMLNASRQEKGEWVDILVETIRVQSLKLESTSIPPHTKSRLDYEDSILKDTREKEALDKLVNLRKNCRHERTERFEDDAMYRCLSCGATGIVGSGRDPV
jgi:hypothetical protein